MLALNTIPAISQVVIHLESIPVSTPDSADIYLAGSINGWNPGDSTYRFEIRPDSGYWLNIAEGSGAMEFKFTRGTWESVEGNENAQFLPNRSFTFGTQDTLRLTILTWEDLDGGGGIGPNTTANEQVQVWDSAMYMPQLDRYRRIWVYLPQDYDDSDKSYPVLYMHDGQNVFDAETSFAGEWKVDEILTELEEEGKESAIVIAIDNGGSHRLDEYSPFINPDLGGGEGNAYLDFIIETLKPRVDSTFRTLNGPEYTGIMGSSMGGLISHHAYFRDPEVFGRIGIFSPSYWFSNEFLNYAINHGMQGSPRFYLVAGSGEAQIAEQAEQMYDSLLAEGFTNEHITLNVVQGGQHAEWFWSQQFEEAFLWLFYPEEPTEHNPSQRDEFLVYPNPADDRIFVRGNGELEIYLFNNLGILIGKYIGNDLCEISLDGYNHDILHMVIDNMGIRSSNTIISK